MNTKRMAGNTDWCAQKLLAPVAGLLAVLILTSGAMCEDLQSAVNRVCQGVQGDDAKAAKLVAAATGGEVGEELAAGVLKIAVDLAIKSADSKTSLQTGIDAIDALIRRSPTQAAYYRSRLDLLCQEAYRRAKPQSQAEAASDVMKRVEAAGDSAAAAGMWEDAEGRYAIALRMAGMSGHTEVVLDGKVRMAKHFGAAIRQAKAVAAAAAAGDKSADVRLGMLYLVSLNNPAKAWELLQNESGEVLRTCVPLAMQDAGGLPYEALIQLSDWYAKSLSPKAEDFARELMLRKARQYAALAQAKGSSAVSPAAGAQVDRAKTLEEQLVPYSYVGRALARNRFLDLLAMADIERDAGRDKWKYAENSFQSSGQDNGSLKFPVQVEGSYQLTIQLSKTKGARDLSVSFPVGGKQLRLRLAEYNVADWLRDRGGRGNAWTREVPDTVLAQVRGAPGRGGPGGHGVPGGNMPPIPGLRGTGIFMRAELVGTGRREGSESISAIDPQYDKRTWVPYDVDIAVKIEDSKATVAVAVGTTHKLSWSGDISALSGIDPESSPITMRFTSAGLAVRSAKLMPRGTVRYSYRDSLPAVAESPVAPPAAPAATQPDGK